MKYIRPWMMVAIIVLLAAVLRFWQLGSVPSSPDWDEVALGYNAYSILHTGRDEYGVFLPRELRSYDDYKPPLYAYLAIPTIAVFGLNVWSVRLPSAVMGTLAVLGTYFLVSQLVHEWDVKKKNIHLYSLIRWLPLISTLLLAISPWHLQFSRIAFEANTGITLNIWGTVAFLYGLESLPWLGASAFLFGLALYAYHSERIFVPLLVSILAVLWRRELFRDKRKVVISILIGLITVAPLIPVVTDATAMTRLKGTSPLTDTTRLLMRTVKKLEQDRQVHDTVGTLLDNRRFVYAETLIDGYISHFSVQWLFLTGDNARHHAPDNGLLYLWELPFVLWGMLWLWKKGGRFKQLLFAWFLIAPIAASPTGGTPHAIRTLVFLPTFQIFSAMGIIQAIACIRKRPLYTYIAGLYVIFMICTTVYYFHMYYTHMDYEYAEDWQYGYAQAVQFSEANKWKYQKIIVSTALEQPHMFFLFYTKYDPAKYLAAGGTASGGFREDRNHFDVYEFRPLKPWSQEIHNGKVLYIGSPKEIPVNPILSIHYPDDKEAIRIAE